MSSNKASSTRTERLPTMTSTEVLTTTSSPLISLPMWWKAATSSLMKTSANTTMSAHAAGRRKNYLPWSMHSTNMVAVGGMILRRYLWHALTS